ncbi:hypothetical protein TMEN_7502 [Trichophyton mentagrophytes]|nr:hypothetical protein TMEN_7502 [Trichophyton mentagrophytes]
MPGLNFTYEYFCDFVPILTRASSSPTNTGNLNPLIHKVLTHYSGSTINGVGGHSVLISISEDLALKVSYRAGGEHIRHEQSIFKLLQAEPCPYIARSYLSALDIILMELVKNGTLYDRMGQGDQPYHEVDATALRGSGGFREHKIYLRRHQPSGHPL